jgi:hypothetical protein
MDGIRVAEWLMLLIAEHHWGQLSCVSASDAGHQGPGNAFGRLTRNPHRVTQRYARI